jgi:type IV secretion system protein VirD4
MLADSSRPIQDLWAEMLIYAHINGRNHPVVSASARDMIDRPANEAGSVLSTTKTFLELYRDPTVAKNTSRSDFRIRDLMHYADPVSLYIITQPNDKARLRPLVRIVVNMIVRLLADKMEFENGRPKPTYKHKLLAMIDEFPALGKLEILQESLAFVAGYGIKCYLISQDINQLKSRETGYGPDETITSNCHVQVAFPPNRLETAEHLSKLTGQTTIVKEQVTRSGRGLGTQVSTMMQEVQRPLLTPDECLRMPGPQKDDRDRITAPGDMVVYCAGFPAIYGRQPLYFEDQTFAARAAIPPPKRSDSLFSLPVPEVQIL